MVDRLTLGIAAAVLLLWGAMMAAALGAQHDEGRDYCSSTIERYMDGIPGETVDGNDVGAVHQAAGAALERARAGEGPTLLIADTYRFGGHYVGDAEVYRTAEEVEARRAGDPILRWEKLLAGTGALDDAGRERAWERAGEETAAAEAFAEQSPLPEASGALESVFTG